MRRAVRKSKQVTHAHRVTFHRFILTMNQQQTNAEASLSTLQQPRVSRGWTMIKAKLGKKQVKYPHPLRCK